MSTMFGRSLFGHLIYAGPDQGGAGSIDTSVPDFYLGQFTVIAYNKSGTKTAYFGSGAEHNALSKVTFEIGETGCGNVELTFHELPSNAELDYMQRIDIHLFGDRSPWYSGYIINRPVNGTTDTTYTFKGYGYYNQLSSYLIFKTYENMDPGDIVRVIAVEAEKHLDIVFNDIKIEKAGYTCTKIVFDGVTIKDALKTLSEFATDFVYGVDERRNIYFKPRVKEINEQARLTVGKHITSYSPTWNVDKVVNWVRTKGGNVDDQGEQWLCVAKDDASIQKYGYRMKVLSLPSAYAVADAQRYSDNYIAQYKDPIKSATVKGVSLEYPLVDGSFNVRHMTTEGMAEIRTLSGDVHDYPITKLKYTVSPDKGISCDMTLGEPPFTVDQYLAGVERNAKNLEQAQATAIKQLHK